MSTALSSRSLRTLAGPLPVTLALLAVVAAGGAASAQGQALQQGLVADGPAPDLFLMYTGDVIGYLDTCGCKKNPAGGLARRAWVLEQVAERYPVAPRLLVDSGNFSDNPTPQGDAKTRSLLQAMEELGYQVVNIGERDVRTGWERTRHLIEGRSMTFVSANIVDKATGATILPGHAIVEATPPGEGGRAVKVGVVGVARYNPLFAEAGPDGTTMAIVHPVERVREEVAAARAAGAERIVLLAALHRDDAKKIAAEVEGIDIVIGSYGGLYTTNDEREGDTWILYSGNQGKRIGETRLFFGDDGSMRQTTRLHFLTQLYPADPAMGEFVGAALAASNEPTATTATGPR